MSNVFDYVNSISLSKKDMMTGTENDLLAEKEYVPFIVNKSLSYFVDSIFHVNEINQFPNLDNKLQYDYLRGALVSRKRFSKWVKKEITDDIKAISEYYNCNYQRSAEILKIINKNDLSMIKQLLQKGGVQKK